MPVPASDQAVADTRRATARIVSAEILKGLAAMARLGGGDMIRFIIFTGIWTANVEHLNADPGRYAQLTDIPPDSLRRPVSRDDLQWRVAIPGDILDHYLDRLIADGTVERLAGGGLIVPSALFTRPEQLAGAGELNVRLAGLIAALRRGGFALGE